MAFLGPFFFLVYGFTNGYTARRPDIPSFYFAWELRLPFVPELMLPYMSIDLFFGASVLLCRTRAELDRHGQRIILAILISATGFLAFPLRFAFERPAVGGFNGALLAMLDGFDKPFNQAPSLHISLLMLLWVMYSRHLSGAIRRLVQLWFVLIAVSVVLCYQHHIIDALLGFCVGMLCLYLLPDGERPFARVRAGSDPQRIALAWRYAAAAAVCTAGALLWGGWAWLLLWPALACGIVAAGYRWFGPAVFQKRDGRHSAAARFLLAPYLLATWLSYRLHTAGRPAAVQITPDVFLGRLPRRGEWSGSPWRAQVDLTAEFSSHPRASHYENIALLDLIPPEPHALRAAAHAIERARAAGPVLVHCALGASRSAAAVIAWLVHHGHVPDVAQGEALLAQKWRTVLSAAHRAALAEAVG